MAGLPYGDLANPGVGGQRCRPTTTGFDERSEISAVVLPWVMAVVLGHWHTRIEGIAEGAVEFSTVYLCWMALAHTVEEVEDDLVAHQEPQQVDVPFLGKDREKGRAIGMPTLVLEGK